MGFNPFIPYIKGGFRAVKIRLEKLRDVILQTYTHSFSKDSPKIFSILFSVVRINAVIGLLVFSCNHSFFFHRRRLISGPVCVDGTHAPSPLGGIVTAPRSGAEALPFVKTYVNLPAQGIS